MKSNDPFRRWFIAAAVIYGHETLRVGEATGAAGFCDVTIQ